MPPASRGRPQIALVTAETARPLDDDLAPLAAALAAQGAVPATPTWDDPAVAWSEFDLVVVRSTWDYTWRRDEFLAWARDVATATTLRNPAPVLEWNTDKTYLAELGRVPVVPTTFVEPGARPAWPAGAFVVKPTVSAGARDTRRFAPGDADEAAGLVERIHAAGKTAMVQPYVESVDSDGELGMVFLGGSFSHAFRKGPILAHEVDMVEGLYAAELIEPAAAPTEALALADAALASVPESDDLLYARVDAVRLPGAAGGWAVLELELTEPSVFFAAADPGAPERFAAAVMACL